jgi:hypothetical protein
MLKSFIATRAGMDYEYYGGDYMLYDQGRNKTITYYGDLEHHKPHGTGFMVRGASFILEESLAKIAKGLCAVAAHMTADTMPAILTRSPDAAGRSRVLRSL